MNESVFYAIDTLHNAISENKSIRFKYFSWNTKGEEEFRRNGELYNVSPWALHFDDERYYLIGYDIDKKEMRHYRVDKMRGVTITKQNRQGKREFNKQDQAKYNEQFFRMYGGDLETITLKCKNEMANVIIDQFGTEVKMRDLNNGTFIVKVDVVVSNQFLSWIIALEGDIVIVGPDSVKYAMKNLLCNDFIE